MVGDYLAIAICIVVFGSAISAWVVFTTKVLKILHDIYSLEQEIFNIDEGIVERMDEEPEVLDTNEDLLDDVKMKEGEDNPFLDPDTGLFSYQYYKKNQSEGKE
jgi:hypothetical protein